jgi:hypothetical protein
MKIELGHADPGMWETARADAFARLLVASGGHLHAFSATILSSFA